MSLDLYLAKDYKQAIKAVLKAQQQTNKSLNLRKLAHLIPIQYTYLSKVMNHEEFHLNEDHVYTISKALKMSEVESEFLLLLRAWSTTQDIERKLNLFSKLESLRREKKTNAPQIEKSTQQLETEMRYWLNPLCVIVHVALSSVLLQKNPTALCSKLGITIRQLKVIMKTLALNDLLVLEDDQITVKEVKNRVFHLSRNHPLVRIHQTQLKTSVLHRLNQTDEDEKHSFMATFTSNRNDFEKIKEEFQTFIKKVETIARRTEKPESHSEVYHLNFDFFKWI